MTKHRWQEDPNGAKLTTGDGVSCSCGFVPHDFVDMVDHAIENLKKKEKPGLVNVKYLDWEPKDEH